MTGLKDQFLLDPEVIFLNHGSFGATPKPVFQEYQRWQRELERAPVEFLGRRATDLMAGSRFLFSRAFSKILLANLRGCKMVRRRSGSDCLSRGQCPTFWMPHWRPFSRPPACSAFQVSSTAGEDSLNVTFLLSGISADPHSMTTYQCR